MIFINLARLEQADKQKKTNCMSVPQSQASKKKKEKELKKWDREGLSQYMFLKFLFFNLNVKGKKSNRCI